jgi:hypothetical protein
MGKLLKNLLVAVVLLGALVLSARVNADTTRSDTVAARDLSERDDGPDRIEYGGHAEYRTSVGLSSYSLFKRRRGPKPPQEQWLDGGTYSTPDTASTAGVELVKTKVAQKFRVLEGIDLGLHARVWRLQYVPAPKD